MTRPRKSTKTSARTALSLIDAMVALVTLGAVTVPIATGIAALSQSGLQNYREVAIRAALVARAEHLRALPFAHAELNVGNSDTSVTLPGGAANMTTTVSLADYDGDLAADPEFKLIVITLEDRELRLHRSDWQE